MIEAPCGVLKGVGPLSPRAAGWGRATEAISSRSCLQKSSIQDMGNFINFWGIETAQSRYYLHTSGPKISITHMGVSINWGSCFGVLIL